MTLVVDASALAFALVGDKPSASAFRRRLSVEDCHAPHLIDAEVGNVLRRYVLRGQLDPRVAARLLHAGARLVDERYPMMGTLALRAWRHRANLTFYDALYVGLASALSAPLLTADEALARAPGLGCSVELIS
jgi:predicted nucleic acid-binding protein